MLTIVKLTVIEISDYHLDALGYIYRREMLTIVKVIGIETSDSTTWMHRISSLKKKCSQGGRLVTR